MYVDRCDHDTIDVQLGGTATIARMVGWPQFRLLLLFSIERPVLLFSPVFYRRLVRRYRDPQMSVLSWPTKVLVRRTDGNSANLVRTHRPHNTNTHNENSARITISHENSPDVGLFVLLQTEHPCLIMNK